jgi:D-beta-D-heptose 7-phosphate kinase/D-beta-D-heptose 1-phosphate adenosyltransferase
MIIRRRDELLQYRRDLRGKGYYVIFTNGCYDLLHYGHIKHLNNLKDMAQNTRPTKVPMLLSLIVAVNSDTSVLEYKGQLPTIEEMDRAVALDEVSGVDVVYIMGESSPRRLIADIFPDFYVKGPDRGNHKTGQSGTICQKLVSSAL